MPLSLFAAVLLHVWRPAFLTAIVLHFAAFLLGLMGWKSKSGKTAVFGAAFLLFPVLTYLFARTCRMEDARLARFSRRPVSSGLRLAHLRLKRGSSMLRGVPVARGSLSCRKEKSNWWLFHAIHRKASRGGGQMARLTSDISLTTAAESLALAKNLVVHELVFRVPTDATLECHNGSLGELGAAWELHRGPTGR